MPAELLTLLRLSTGLLRFVQRRRFLAKLDQKIASALARLSYIAAERLLRDAANLPSEEAQIAIRQAADHLEFGLSVNDWGKRDRSISEIWTGRSASVQTLESRLEHHLWLAAAYGVLGYYSKATTARLHARTLLPGLRSALEGATRANAFAGCALGPYHAVSAIVDEHRCRHRNLQYLAMIEEQCGPIVRPDDPSPDKANTKTLLIKDSQPPGESEVGSRSQLLLADENGRAITVPLLDYYNYKYEYDTRPSAHRRS